MRGRWVRGTVFVAMAVLAAACGGGGDDETADTVALEELEPIVDIDPCDLLDSGTASALSGADVGDAESTTEDDGTTRCDFAFADEDTADEAGSAIAASLSIGPGSDDDVPGGDLARTLSIGDRGAVEEEDDKVRVVYVVREVVVRVEVVPGSGEVTPEIVDDVIAFTETTEAPVTEAVTGEPFVPDTTTTTFVDEEVPEGDPIEVDGDEVTLTVDRAGGLANAVFEGEEGDIVFLRIPAASVTPAEGCIRVNLVDPEDGFLGGGGCANVDGTSFVDRTVLPLDGVYQVLLDPDGPATGSVTVRLTSATDEEGTIEIDGATETATIEQAGAIARLEFQASAGDAIFVSVPAATLGDPDQCLRLAVIGPEEAFISGGGCVNTDGTTFIDRTELEVGGTYAIVLDGDGTQTGSADVQVTAAD